MTYVIIANDSTLKTVRDFSLFYSNVRSINKNLNLLLSLITQQEQTNDIIATTETWLKKNENVRIPGYKTVSEMRDSASRGGGVAFFVRCGLRFSVIPYVACHTLKLCLFDWKAQL